ncbi:MAG: DUF3365 domain-containing protein [Planctomycetales bacterium]|nr:DUF3365 domain-containing protein [Planctomycetales bacterium]
MKRNLRLPVAGWLGLAMIATLAVNLAATLAEESSPDATPSLVEPCRTVAEARARAQLLHESFHATLRIVHRRYYREDEGLKIPSATLDEVFAALEPRCDVRLHWLVVNAEAMNVDHAPRDQFEKDAVAALAAGQPEFEQSSHGVYRHAGPIVLTSECLKCHLPDRKSTDDRLAGLVISMPLGHDARDK